MKKRILCNLLVLMLLLGLLPTAALAGGGSLVVWSEDFSDSAGEPGAVSEDRASPPREKGAEKREKSEIVPVHVASGALDNMKKPGKLSSRALC